MLGPPNPSPIGEPPDVTVVVVNYNTAHLLDRMFAALEAAEGDLRLQVIVVDNASRDSSVDVLRTEFPDAELIANHDNVGFGRANNQALPRVRGRYVLLLNTDAFVRPIRCRRPSPSWTRIPRCGVLGVQARRDATARCSRPAATSRRPGTSFSASTGLRAVLSGHAPGGRHVVGPRIGARMRLGAGLLLPGAARGDRPRRPVRPSLFPLLRRGRPLPRGAQAGWSVIYYPFTQVVHIGGESAESEGPLTASAGRSRRCRSRANCCTFGSITGFLGVLASGVSCDAGRCHEGLQWCLAGTGCSTGCGGSASMRGP